MRFAFVDVALTGSLPPARERHSAGDLPGDFGLYLCRSVVNEADLEALLREVGDVTAVAHGVGRGLTILALVLAGLFGLLAVMFTAGETFADPGGWQAVGLIALWLVPMIALLALALARPAVAQPILEALTAVWAVVAVWSILAP
ncbi:MAG: hypothetical protein ACXV0U_08910, partial [Kineosporiaceae bacterium]